MAQSDSNFILKVAKGDHSYCFMLEQSDIDYFHQADPCDSFLRVLSFLESCIENGSINMNINELHDEKTKFHISIPERVLNNEVPVNTSLSSHCNTESISEHHTFKDSSNNNYNDKKTDISHTSGQMVQKLSLSVGGLLTLHRRTHTGEKPYLCDVCGKSFSRSKYLTKHQRLLHTTEKKYACNLCDKSFTYSHHLMDHRRRHTGEKPYLCDVCSKSFYTRGELTTHRRVHTGEKPHACDVCGKSFSTRSHFTRHRRIHDEKPFACDLCAKSFRENDDLTTHRRIHDEKPFACDLCAKSFRENDDLTTHRRFHTDEKP